MKIKHIGIVGVSGEGAALCYHTIVNEGLAMSEAHGHPEVTMHTFPHTQYLNFARSGEWEKVGKLLLESGKKCAKAGADFLICPANTTHQGLDLVLKRSPLPWLHIADEVAAVAQEKGYKRTAILGTRFLMEGPVYPPRLAARGIRDVIPEPEDRQEIDRIIFDELVDGRLYARSRDYVSGVIDGLAERECDSVALACTEIPLLITQEDSSLPIIDSTRTLARAALAHAFGNRPAMKV